MEEKCHYKLPVPLWEDIFLAAVINECYLRPISTMCEDFLLGSNPLKRTLHITSSNAHSLPKLLKRFPNIKHINLPFFIDPAKFFGQISRFSISLESLDMSLMSSFPIKKLPPTTTLKATLKSLKLTYVEDQTDVDGDLEILADLFPNLEELELFWSYKVTNNGVAKLSSKLKRLRKVTIAGNSLITDASIQSLVKNCSNLEEITLNQCLSVSPEGISFAFRHCRKLKSFVMEKMFDIRNGIPVALARNLTSLEFSSMSVSDELLCAIARSKIPLKRVSLSDCEGYTGYGLLCLLDANKLHLEYFAIEKTCLSPNSMAFIPSYLRNVKTAKLNYCFDLSFRTFLGLIHNCLKLHTLEVKGDYTTHEHSNTVFYGRTSQLRSLNLSYSRMITDKYLSVVSKACPYLSHLFINGCKAITYMGLSRITRSCLGLKTIHMNGCDGIFTLGLEEIMSPDYKLQELEARGSGLDDECLKVIALKCPDILCIDVTNCQYVTALGVREIATKCRNLERLGVSYKYIDPDTEYFIRSKKPWLVNRL